MKKIVLFFVFVLFGFLSFSQDPFCESMVVEGKSSVKMTPEVITFTVNFYVRDTIYARCASSALQKIDAIKSQFSEQGIETELIKTGNYSIREERERDRNTGEQIFKGYRADIPVFIKTKANDPKNDKIFEIIKDNFKADFRINFSLSPEQIEEMKEELIALAVKDAKSKAQLLAKNTGVKLNDITKVQYGEPRTIRNFTRSNYDLLESGQLMMASASARGNLTSLTPNEVEMRTNVMVAWGFEYK